MKQPDFKRKAIGFLLAPLALAALPAGAMTLDVTNFDGWSEIYSGWDEVNNRYFFYVPSDNSECKLISLETSENSLTIPETVNILNQWEEWNDETGEYEQKTEALATLDVTGFYLHPDDYWMTEPFGNMDSLKDITLTDKIESFIYRNWNNSGPKLQFHFTSETAPGYIEDSYMDALYLVFAPEANLDTYKDAFSAYNAMVLAEGADPAAEFEKAVAETGALPISYHDGTSGINIVTWTGTDKDGNLFGFEEYGGEITLRGMSTTASSINIPQEIVLVEPENYRYSVRTVTRSCLDNYNETDTGFPGCTNLTDIYMPSTMHYSEFHGEGYAMQNFHYTTEEAPEFYFGSGSENRVNIRVPEALFAAYTEALGDQDYMLWPEEDATPVTVNVATPGTLAEEVASIAENLSDVRWLVVTGTPDEIDLRMIRRLPRLEKLDLSATTGLTTVGGFNGLKYLKEVALPEGITAIDNYAFNKCRSLRTLNLPATVTEIGEYAFAESGIHTLDLSHVVNFGNYAFHLSKISNVDLSAAEVLGTDVFLETPLGTVKFGENIREIGNSAFRSANLVGEVEIPAKVRVINHWMFAYNDKVTKFIIPKDVVSINDQVFEGTKPEVVECNVLFPLEENGFRYADLSNCTLYVPSLTLNAYLLNDHWVDFTAIESLPGDLKTLDIDREFTLKSDTGIADKADLNMQQRYEHEGYMYPEYAYKFGHLTVDRTADLNLGTYNQKMFYEGEYWDPYYGTRYMTPSTLIPESVVTADNVELTLNIRRDRWYFIALPYDVNVKDIVVDEDALWVVRKYNGEARANLEENTWQNMTDDTVLKAGEGYIFNCATERDTEYVSFRFPAATDANALFAKDAVVKELKEYTSEFAHNASWNLAGNTYPAYLNLKAVEFDGPVTVWEDYNYYAYSPVDDDYVLNPFQAFFVQRQNVEGGNAVTLNPAGRAHSREAALALDLAEPQTRAAAVTLNRSLFNIHINGEAGADRTRIVVNNEASFAYEANRDASKFMSTSEVVPQIFVNNNNVRMAISESPLGNGQFTLGTRFGKSGSYTISLDTRNAAGYSVLLTDNVTGVTTDLTASAYTFNADAALDDSRFTVTIGLVSGVESAVAEGLDVKVEGNVLNITADEAVEIIVVAADGKVVVSEKAAEFSATLEQGIYVVKVGNAVTKVNIGK